MTTRCYWCEMLLDITFNEGVVEDAGGDTFYCDSCEQYQHNSEECGCLCELTDEELYNRFTGSLATSEVLEMGLEGIRKEVVTLWATNMDGFQDKFMPYAIKDEEKIDKASQTIYEYALKDGD